VSFARGDLVWADLGFGRGTPPGKIRPVVIVQSNLLIEAGHRSTVVLLCTSQIKGETIIRAALPAGAAGNQIETEVLVDQMFAIDNRAFKRKLGTVPKVIMKEVDFKLSVLLNLGLNLG